MRRKTSSARTPRLREYREKRDFQRTPEPAGLARTVRPAARFVVQEHHASVLHYDFRLEIGGVLKSWSVPKGPSLDPSVRRLAIQVEDHPVDYLTFAGRIPEGNYGAGTVHQWDLGTFEPLDPDPLRAWKKGTLKFRLHGRRLKGEWRLFRIRSREGTRKPPWLLAKVKDLASRPGHEAERIGDEPLTRRSPRRRPSTRTASALPLDEFLKLEAPGGNRDVDVEGARVTLTHLDRVYWTEPRLTKHDLLKYYVQAWPRLGPYVKGRPAILHRYPEGFGGSRFVQHDLARVPEYVVTRTLTNESGRKIAYAVYTGLASLLYLTNLGTLEHHPWHSTIEHLARPDWLVLDLDPGSVRWDDVLGLALEARKVFEKRGLRAWPKTSGSRGIHLYVPIVARYPYEQVSALAHELATEIVGRAPDLATVERSLGKRKKSQIYVDWLQNARGKSVAAPYSARVRAGAPVSMPVTWEEIERGVRISDFTVPSAAERSDDPWAGFFEGRQRL